MPARHKFTHEQIEELKQAYRFPKSKLAEKHIRAVLLYAQGKPYAEICEITGYSEINISKLVTSYSREGLKAIQGHQGHQGHRGRQVNRRKGAFAAIGAGDSSDRSRRIAALVAALNLSSDSWEKRRLTAVLLSSRQFPMEKIMQKTRYSAVQIRRLCGEYLDNGLDKFLAHKSRPYNDERLWSQKVTPQQIEEVKKVYETAAHPVVAKRCKLVLLRMQGMTNMQAAKEAGMTENTATKVFCTYIKEGLPALQRISTYRGYRFTKEQVREVEEAFEHAQYLKDKARLEVLVLRAHGATLKEIRETTGFGIMMISKDINYYLKYGLPKSPHGGG